MSRKLEVRVLEYHPPGQPGISIGVFVFDAHSSELLWRFREDLHVADEFDQEYLQEFTSTLAAMVASSSPSAVFDQLDTSLSSVLRFGYEATLHSDDPQRELDAVFMTHVARGEP